MPPQSKPGPVETPKQRRFRLNLPQSKKGRIVAGLVIIAVLSIAGYYWKSNDTKKPKITTYSFTYSTLKDIYVKGQVKGSGFKFKVPTEIISTSILSPSQAQVNYTHAQSGGAIGKVGVIAHEGAATVHVANILKSYRTIAEQALSDSSDSKHASYVASMKNYVRQRLPIYDVSFSDVKTFKSDNLASDAWEIDYTAKAKANQNQSTYPNLSGESIFAMGKSAFYYLMVDAATYNWQPNSHIWQQAINSFQIDQ